MHILFVTRKYPPSKGGMENAAFELYTALAANASNRVKLIKWGGSNTLLPVVYLVLFVRSLAYVLGNKPDIIYLQDGVMAPLGWLLRLFTRRPTVMTIHGKEATYANPVYKLMVVPFVPRQNLLLTISKETEKTIKKAFPGTRPLIIYDGVTDKFYSPLDRDSTRARLAATTGLALERLQRAKILHTHGRLVRRKGVLWFIDNVLPKLVANNPDILYVVSGDGKDRELIETAIADRKLSDNVVLLGLVTDEVRDLLYNAADLFVMPNIPVAKDMEGFGLVASEAASCGTMVVASDLEGIKDAIIDGKNGVMVKPGDAAAYVSTIEHELKRRSIAAASVRTYTLKNYSWSEAARQHEAAMAKLIIKYS